MVTDLDIFALFAVFDCSPPSWIFAHVDCGSLISDLRLMLLSLDAQLTDEVDFHPIRLLKGEPVSLRGSIHLPQVLSLQLSRGARGIKAQSKKMKKMNWEVQVISN